MTPDRIRSYFFLSAGIVGGYGVIAMGLYLLWNDPEQSAVGLGMVSAGVALVGNRAKLERG